MLGRHQRVARWSSPMQHVAALVESAMQVGHVAQRVDCVLLGQRRTDLGLVGCRIAKAGKCPAQREGKTVVPRPLGLSRERVQSQQRVTSLTDLEDGVDQSHAVLASPSPSPYLVGKALGSLKDRMEVVVVVDLVDAVAQEPRVRPAVDELAAQAHRALPSLAEGLRLRLAHESASVVDGVAGEG